MYRVDAKPEALRPGVLAEAQSPPSLFPSRVVERVVLQRVDEAASKISAELRQGVTVLAGPTVQVPKSRYGYRPVLPLTFQTRAAYRMLAGSIEEELGAPDRTRSAWERFESFPLVAGVGAGSILRADIAAFYQSIDHEQLVLELVRRTGLGFPPRAIGELLGAVMGARRGLPQNNAASHVLADAFLGRLDGELRRSGIVSSRYNDDFVFAFDSWADAHGFLEIFVGEVAAMGLSINEQKTRFFTRSNYESWVGRHRKIWDEIDSELEWTEIWSGGSEIESGRDATVEEITGEENAGNLEADLELRSRKSAAALSAVNYALERLRGGPPSAGPLSDWLLEQSTLRRLLGEALVVLQRYPSDDVGAQFVQVVRTEVQLTHLVGGALAALAPLNPTAVASVLRQVVTESDSPRLSNWQTLWLVQPVLEHDLSWEPDWAPVGAWLSVALHSSESHPIVRSRALAALARWREINADGCLVALDALRFAGAYALDHWLTVGNVLGREQTIALARSSHWLEALVAEADVDEVLG